MREIKAPRAWLKEHERMVEVLAINWDIHGNMILVDIVAPYPGGDPDERAIVGEPPSILELMWPTGLKDKNGTEIYEGDVLRDDVGDLGIVRFGKLPLDKSGDCVCGYSAFYVECKGQIGRAPMFECAEIGDWMEIIDNIHQNPELLELKSP